MKVGVDIVKNSRFNIENHSYKKILSPSEIKRFHSFNDKSKQQLFLASRWAIKEAIYKTNNNVSHFNTIDIIKVKNELKYKGYESKYLISLSHESDYCVSFVIYLD